MKLKELRIAAGLTQKDLSIIAQVSTPTIGFFEAGKKKPHPRTISKLAEALNVQPEDLIPKLT